MTGFQLKLLAMLAMTADHIGAVFFPEIPLLRWTTKQPEYPRPFFPRHGGGRMICALLKRPDNIRTLQSATNTLSPQHPPPCPAIPSFIAADSAKRKQRPATAGGCGSTRLHD